MAKLIIFLLAAVIFVTIVSCHPGHKNKEQVQKVHKKKHGGHVSHGHHKHQMESERQEDEIYAMEEAKQVIESLDDLSSAVQSVSLAVENGVNYRGNEIDDEKPSRPRPFLMNVLKNVFKNLHRVQSTYQDDAPRFKTNFNNSIYECSKNEEESEQHAFSSMYLPKEVMIFADEKNERSILMETHGLVTDDELEIYSVIRGKLLDMDMLIPSLSLLEDPLINLPSQVKPDGQIGGRQSETASAPTTSQRPPLIVTVGEAVGDYMFRTVHALLSRMIHNMEDGHAVSALLRCEMDSIECLVDQRYDATGLRMCSSTLCKCMEAHLPEIGTILRPTMSP